VQNVMDGLAEVIAPHPALRTGAAELGPTDLVEQVRSSELVDVVDDAVVSAVAQAVSRASGELARHPEEHREDAAGRSPVDLEVIIPADNESGRLPATLAAMVAFLSEQPWTSRVVVVDNGSVDDTAATVLAVTGRACNVATGWCVEAVAIGCSQAGKGAAVHRGLRTSRSRIVGFTDADLSTPLETFDDATAVTARAARPAQDRCAADDPTTSVATGTPVATWSNLRFARAQAARAGLAAVGENPGPPAAQTGGTASSDPEAAQVRRSPAYARGCALAGFFLAFESVLDDPSSGVTRQDYVNAVVGAG
jgi:glycosyl transferase family 2